MTRGRFALVVAALLALVVFTPREPVLAGLLSPLDRLTARATATLLESGGVEVAREGTVLSHPGGFAYEIYWRCTGLLPAVFLAGLVLASPGPRRHRLAGVAGGVVAVLGVNLVRLVHLFVIGATDPAVFDLAHSALWEGGMVGLVVALWLGWMRWSAP